MVEATRPVVEGQLAQHPCQHPGRRGLAEPWTPGRPLVGVGRVDAVGGRRRGPSRAGAAMLSRLLRVLGSDTRWASHAPPLSVPLSPAGSTLNPTLTRNRGESKACYERSAKAHAEGDNFREHPPSRILGE